MSDEAREPPTLRTERLLLRPFRLTDAEDVYAYANDEEWSRFLARAPWPYTRKDGEEWVARCVLTDWRTRPQFALELDGAAVGGVNVRIDPEAAVAELGYFIWSAHWNKGLMTEAARAVLDWTFESHAVEKVYARADARNEASLRVMEKLGMRHEGTLRSQRVHRGERVDEVYYGLLRGEWEGARPSRRA